MTKQTNSNKEEILLFKLQSDFIKEKECSKKSKIIESMYKVGCIYSKRIIIKMVSKSGIVLSKEILKEKSIDTTTLLLSNYYSRPGYVINRSFGKVLKWKAQEVLYGHSIKKEEQYESLNNIINESSERSDFIFDQLHDSEKLKLVIKEDTQEENIKKQELVYEAIIFYYTSLRKQGYFYEASMFLTFIFFNLNETHYKIKNQLYSYIPFMSKNYGENCLLTIKKLFDDKELWVEKKKGISYCSWKLKIKKELSSKKDEIINKVKSLNRLKLRKEDIVSSVRDILDIKGVLSEDKKDYLCEWFKLNLK